jgi:hypothetical protein
MTNMAISRAAFAERFPKIIENLDQPGAISSTLIVENGVVVDAMVNDSRLYGGDARKFTADQVESFLKKPLRLFMDRPTNAGLVSPICVDLHDSLGRFLIENSSEEICSHTVDSPSFLVVFGLGLGHHLKDLSHGTKARWLIVVEPMIDFIAHSFHTVDWTEIFAHFEGQGGGVHVVTELDPGKMSSAIVGFMADQGIPYVDGSHIFTHYPFWAFAEGRNRLYEGVKFAFINRGFFEDEIKMMTNAVSNFAAAPFLLLEGRPRLHRPELAVIVGAGPSLDEALPRLREIRDRVILFSAGTALRPLLRNGFVPDFHCELENVPAAVDAIREAGKYGDVSKITLIASATVDPRIPPMFAETIYFFRDSVSSTQLLGDKHLPIAGATPTCVNMAVSMAAFMGFTDMALFGADCGVRVGGQDHASDTIYRDVAQYKTENTDARFPIEVEGNFGGIARSNWIYDSCRLMLAEVIQQRSLNAFNGSDGAFIPGTIPRVPESIKPTTGAIDHAAIRAALKRALEHFTPADIFAETDLSEIAGQSAAMFKDLDLLLDGLGQGEADFGVAYSRVMKFIETAHKNYGRADSLIAGTLQALPRIAMFFGFRVADPDLRKRLYGAFIGEFKRTASEMANETKTLFDHLLELTSGIDKEEPARISLAG